MVGIGSGAIEISLHIQTGKVTGRPLEYREKVVLYWVLMGNGRQIRVTKDMASFVTLEKYLLL